MAGSPADRNNALPPGHGKSLPAADTGRFSPAAWRAKRLGVGLSVSGAELDGWVAVVFAVDCLSV